MEKIFILDEQGGYTGEYVVNDECVIEYGDFLRSVPEAGLGDQDSVFLGEYVATVLHGDRMSLVAVSKGRLTVEDLAWAKAVLTATEAHLTDAKGSRTPGTEPDRGVMESLVSALDAREKDLAAREKAIAEAVEAARREGTEDRSSLEGELKSVRQRLEDLEARRAEERKEFAAEAERLHKEVEDARRAAASISPDRDQLERDRKMLQKRAVDLFAREEKVRERETELATETERLEAMRQDIDATLATVEAARQSAAQRSDVEAAQKEISMRVKILQQKALDLLDREEQLRKREAELAQVSGA